MTVPTELDRLISARPSILEHSHDVVDNDEKDRLFRAILSSPGPSGATTELASLRHMTASGAGATAGAIAGPAHSGEATRPTDVPGAREDSGDGRGLVASQPRRPSARRWAVGLVVTVVAAAAVISALATAAGPAWPKGTFTTAWVPSRPASSPAGAAASKPTPGSFRLVSYLQATSFSLGTNGPRGKLTCPTVMVCYVAGFTGENTYQWASAATRLPAAVYGSDDGGVTWSSLALPKGLEFGQTPGLSCPAARVCAGTGWFSGKKVFISTSDGGHRWRLVPSPLPGPIELLSCPSASVCDGVTESPPGSSQSFVRTTDGGLSWSAPATFPLASTIYALVCPSVAECVATGSYYARGSTLPDDFAMSTSDGGSQWQSAQFPGTTGLLTLLSCANASDCTAASVFGGIVPPASQTSAPPNPPCTPSLQGGDGCPSLEPNVALSVDGGRRWVVRPMHEAKFLSATMCPGQSRTSLMLDCAAQDNKSGAEHGAGVTVVQAKVYVACVFNLKNEALGRPQECGPDPDVMWGTTGMTPQDFQLPDLASRLALSCPAPGQCWLAGPWGPVATTDNGSTWTVPHVAKDSPNDWFGHATTMSLSCPAVGDCVALGTTSARTSCSGGPSPNFDKCVHRLGQAALPSVPVYLWVTVDRAPFAGRAWLHKTWGGNNHSVPARG